MAIFTIDKQAFHHIPEGMPAFERLPRRLKKLSSSRPSEHSEPEPGPIATGRSVAPRWSDTDAISEIGGYGSPLAHSLFAGTTRVQILCQPPAPDVEHVAIFWCRDSRSSADPHRQSALFAFAIDRKLVPP